MPRTTTRDPAAIKGYGVYHLECYDKDGNLKWSEDAENALFDEGEFMILDVALRAGTAPAQFNIGLFKSTLAAPAETSTLSALKTGTNYELTDAANAGYGTTTARKQVNRDATANGWPTLSLNAGDYQATGKTVSWTATGNWADTVRWIFMTNQPDATDLTGKLYSVAQLSADRTLLNGDTLNVTYSLKLQ
jgi:hypothetical protein